MFTVPDFNTETWETRRACPGRHHADPCRPPFSYDEALVNHACIFNQCRYCSAYVFTRDIAGSSTSSWTQRAKLVAADGAVYDMFGASVSISGRGLHSSTRQFLSSIWSLNNESPSIYNNILTQKMDEFKPLINGDTIVAGADGDDDKVGRSELKRLFAPSE
jgi:hypothetical protein